MFPIAEKLLYYNIAYGVIYAHQIAEGEDWYEEEDTKDTVAGQSDYKQESRIHHVNWLKIDYGDGFIPAHYKSEADLISENGTDLTDVLANWPKSDPIYYYKGKHLFVVPAPASGEEGADRLWVSQELYPADLTAGDTPDLPETSHYLLAVYAAWMYHKNNSETELADAKAKDLPIWMVRPDVLHDAQGRTREAELIAHVADDDGTND